MDQFMRFFKSQVPMIKIVMIVLNSFKLIQFYPIEHNK